MRYRLLIVAVLIVMAAVQGRAPVTVSGLAGREALDVALQIVREIERGLPALRKPTGVPARA